MIYKFKTRLKTIVCDFLKFTKRIGIKISMENRWKGFEAGLPIIWLGIFRKRSKFLGDKYYHLDLYFINLSLGIMVYKLKNKNLSEETRNTIKHG